ncbi:Acetylcholinesterase [Diplocarpon rosae]|nr:Acetylcholinesterase [Diplocarpon rosae]
MILAVWVALTALCGCGYGAATASDSSCIDGTDATNSTQQEWQVGQTVRTSSGEVRGHRATKRSSVSEYLGIPYAEPPVGKLRWAAPQPFRGSAVINGSSFGHSCAANAGVSYQAVLANAANLNLTRTATQVLDTMIGQSNEVFSEDCLTLNIWTKPQAGERKKAVMLWIYGGSFMTGSSINAAYNGQHLADEEDIVVVSINYRVNIFGFPGAPNASNNVGLLDQRLAVEWTRDNIDTFGGDPHRITIVGESAGAGSVDFYSFAYTHDPIVAGFIAQSGTASNALSPNASASIWYQAASLLNCGDATSHPDAVLSCMRARDQDSILQAIAGFPDFGPIVDNEVVFSDADTVTRAATGQFVRKPYLLGVNNNEAGLFHITYQAGGQTFPESWWKLLNEYAFNCGAAHRSKAAAAVVPTWRYRYFGDFPNLALSTTPLSGAWHGSEIPTIFGTDLEVQNLTARTASQGLINRYMQGAWAAFALMQSAFSQSAVDVLAGLTKAVADQVLSAFAT